MAEECVVVRSDAAASHFPPWDWPSSKA